MDEFQALLAKRSEGATAAPAEGEDEFSALLAKRGKTGSSAASTRPGEIPRDTSLKAPPAASQDASSLGKLVRGQGVLETGADAADIVLGGLPAIILGSIGEVTQRVSSLVDGRGYREGAKAGAEFSRSMGEKFGRPIFDNLVATGLLDPKTRSVPMQAMDKLGGYLEHAATVVEHDTKGVISREDYLASINGFMAAMGVKGAQAMTQGAINRARARGTKTAWDTALERYDAEEQLARSRFEEVTPERTAAKAAAERPADDGLYGGDFVQQAAARREAYLRRKAYEKSVANFPPSGERTGSRGPVELNLEGKETPTTYSGNQPFHTADTTTALKRGIIADTPIEAEGTLRPAARPALDTALEKVKGGRLFDMTMEERLALRNSVDITDPKVITAAAVGATGLGLAMAYEPSAEEAVLAIGAGALLRRGGEGLPMRELLAKPEATPLGALLEASAYTTSTLEKLAEQSPGKFEFKKSAVEQLLKREGVTKHERDIMTAAMAEVPRDTVTAKELMVGLKLATKDFELTPEVLDGRKFDYADFGLERIDRSVDGESDLGAPQLPPLDQLAVSGRRVVDSDGQILDNLFPGQTLQEWYALHSAPTPEARNPVARFYTVPEGLDLGPLEAAINDTPGGHIYRPNTFGHTRSFEEGGVRHVVELQNNQAQYAEKAVRGLDPEGIAKAKELQEVNATLAKFWNRVQYGSSRAGEYSFWEALDRFKQGESKLSEVLGHNDQRMLLESGLYRELEHSFAGQAIKRAFDDFSEKKYAAEGGQQAGAEGFLDWLEGSRTSIPPEGVRNLRDAIHAYAGGLASQAEMNASLYASKARGVGAKAAYDRISPMLKDWHKRLVREEIADAERTRGQTQNLIAEKQRAIAAFEAELRATSSGIPQDWVGDRSLSFRQAAGILRKMSAGLREEKLTEQSVRDKMLRIEAQLDPQARAKWQEYYENYADETEGFLRPTGDEIGAEFGQRYAANFSDAMADFFTQAVGKQDSVAAREYLAGLHEDITRLEGQSRPVIRFATADTVAKVEGWSDLHANYRDVGVEPRGSRFRPEHQGIYDRYQKDVEKFLRQLGGKPYTDSAGHTWLEVPLGEQQKTLPGGGARTQIGGVDPALAKAVGLVGGSAALAAWLSRDKDKVKHAGMAALLTGLGLLVHSRVPAVAKMVTDTIDGVQNLVGNLSTDKAVSAPLLRRLTSHAEEEMRGVHDSGKRIAPFLEIVDRLPQAVRKDLDAALSNGRTSDIVAAVGKAATPGLLKAWNDVQAELMSLGKQLIAVKGLKELRPDYFPRIVKDLPGLMNAIGKEFSTPLQQALDAAERRSGGFLDEAGRTQVINTFIEKNLRAANVGGKPSFFKRRTLGDVTVDLAPYYVEPSQALPLYIGSAVRAIEKAKFFGKELVRDDGGRPNLEASIGNIVAREIDAGNITPENFTRLTELLRTRFGPAYQSPARGLQSLSQLTNIALLGNVFSGLMNVADVGAIAAQHGVLPLVAAVTKMVRGTAKLKAADVGMAEAIGAEFVYGTRDPVKLRIPLTERTVQVSLAKALDKTFKLSGFKALDTVMKEVNLNAAMEKYSRLARTKSGEARILRQYGDYFTTDMPALLADLRAGAKTKLTTELAFRELSDAQPTTKIEMPKFYLDHPNLRFGYALKSFMIKQMNFVKKRGIDEIRKGNLVEGGGFITRYVLMAGAAGATMDWVVKSLLGRDADLDWKSIPLNALKNLGLSEYVIDKARQGKGKEAILAATVPPADPILNIITADPQAVRYFPLVGRLAYDRLMDGAEKANAAKKLAEKRKAADARRTPEERRALEQRALERRKELVRER